MENSDILQTEELIFDCTKKTCQRVGFNICSLAQENEQTVFLSGIMSTEARLANRGKKNELKAFEHKCKDCFWCSKKDC